MAHLFLVHFAKPNHAFAETRPGDDEGSRLAGEGWYKNGPSKTVGYVDENGPQTLHVTLIAGVISRVTLPETNIAMENPPF